MLKNVELPFYPSTTNCLVWSEDGELAIAAGEFIHLLVPKHKGTANSRGVEDAEDPWVAVRFRVNGFTTEEWPMQEPVGFEDFSIGEEQAVSTVTALSWSAPGPGKNRRSVLAVLTSNLVLSIWESRSDPKEPESWDRVMVVNHSLEKYFPSHDVNPSVPDASNGSLCRRTRIRAFAWAKPLRSESKHGHASFQSKWGDFLLAVTNDNGEIIILRIVSPYSMEINQSSKWNAAVLWHGKALPATYTVQPAQPSLLSAVMAEQRFVRDLMWGPWTHSEGCNAPLTYTWGIQVYSLEVAVLSLPVHITAALDCDEVSKAIETRGPVHTSIMTQSDCLMLSCCYKQADDSGISTNITAIANRNAINVWAVRVGPEQHTEIPDINSHPLKTKTDRWRPAEGEVNAVALHPWDRVSGLAICKEQNATESYLYITTHLSHLEVLKYTPVGELKWTTCADTLLQSRMSDCRMRFDNGHDLGGLSVMKTWGLASLGGHIVTLLTVHPGDMIEYTITSLERSTIVFGQVNDKDRQFPWERAPEHAVTEAGAQARIIDTIFTAETDQDGKDRSVLTNRIIYAATCASMQLWDSFRSERLERAKEALRKLESVIDFAFVLEIAYIERLLADQDVDHERQASQIQDLTQQIRDAISLNTPTASRIHEMCSICGESIIWDSFDGARCARGHAFARCALTFLTIQEPGISKYCESCDREYLDGQVLVNPRTSVDGCSIVESKDPSVEASGEGTTTLQVEEIHDIGSAMPKDSALLARLLFSTYDLCVYCGGKFIA